jgi:hypothetical protein
MTTLQPPVDMDQRLPRQRRPVSLTRPNIFTWIQQWWRRTILNDASNKGIWRSRASTSPAPATSGKDFVRIVTTFQGTTPRYGKEHEDSRTINASHVGHLVARIVETTDQHLTMALAARRRHVHQPETPLRKLRSHPNPSPSGARAARTQEASPTTTRAHPQHPQPLSPTLHTMTKFFPHRSTQTREVYA